MHPGFKSSRNFMWISLYASAFQPHVYHVSLVRTIVEITERINSQTSETVNNSYETGENLRHESLKSRAEQNCCCFQRDNLP